MGEIAGVKILTASGLVKRGPGYILGIFITTPTHNLTAKFFDNTEASGTKVYPDFVQVATGDADWHVSFVHPIPFSRGLYVQIMNANPGDQVGVQVV